MTLQLKQLIRLAILPTMMGLALLGGCSRKGERVVTVASSPEKATAESSQEETFELGLSKASDAAFTTSRAENKEDWELAIARWESAIHSLEAVPKGDRNYAQAQEKIIKYKQDLISAQKKQKTLSSKPSSVVTQKETHLSPKQNKNSLAQSKINDMSAKDFLGQYMDSLINQGRSGEEYFCSQYKALQQSFFAPRSWRLLNEETAPDGVSGNFTIQLDSSNKGGAQITANWFMVVTKEEDIHKSQQLPGGWCVASVWEK
jgi:hypothetical protein